MLAQGELTPESLISEMGQPKPAAGGCRTCLEFTHVQRAFIELAGKRGFSAARIVIKLEEAFNITISESSIKNHLRKHVTGRAER